MTLRKLTPLDGFRLLRLLGLIALSASALAPAAVRRVMLRKNHKFHEALGSEIARFCARSGPAAIKLAQLLSARADLLPAALVKSLSTVHDDMAPPSVRAIRATLARTFGEIDALPFDVVSWKPIAVGSVAFVLEGRTHENQRIVIKLLRPGVRRRILSDLRLIVALLTIVERFSFAKGIPLRAVFLELSDSIAGQCDLKVEAASAKRMAAIMGDRVKVPLPIDEFVHTDALAMQLLTAQYRFHDEVPPDIFRFACYQLLRALYLMIFEAGFVHCDFHPGNIAIDSNGTPILYDYGLVAELRQVDLQNLRSLFMAIATRNSHRAADEVLRSAVAIPDDFDRATFNTEIAVVVKRWSGKPAGEFLVALLVRDLFAVLHRHRVRNMPGFVAAIWALSNFEGLVRHRFPDLDFQGEALRFFLEQSQTKNLSLV